MTILEHYFYLSDLAVTDKRSLQKLCCLFKDDAIIEANDGHRYSGRREIDSFFTEFFSRNAETRHLYDIRELSDTVHQANWGVVCRRKNGAYIALTGTDIAEVEEGKISHLTITSNN